MLITEGGDVACISLLIFLVVRYVVTVAACMRFMFCSICAGLTDVCSVFIVAKCSLFLLSKCCMFSESVFVVCCDFCHNCDVGSVFV